MRSTRLSLAHEDRLHYCCVVRDLVKMAIVQISSRIPCWQMELFAQRLVKVDSCHGHQKNSKELSIVERDQGMVMTEKR